MLLAMARTASLAVMLLLLGVVVPDRALANCAEPTTYQATAAGNTVTVCLRNFGARQCPDQGLLRQNPANGELVSLADCDSNACFVDECVPQGTYRYGLKDPYACNSASCGTYYFAEATVSTALGSCTRTSGFTGPTAFTGGAPWGNNPQICGYGPSCGCASTGAGAVFALNAVALGAGLLLRARERKRRSP
jgi:hypothetical protein